MGAGERKATTEYESGRSGRRALDMRKSTCSGRGHFSLDHAHAERGTNQRAHILSIASGVFPQVASSQYSTAAKRQAKQASWAVAPMRAQNRGLSCQSSHASRCDEWADLQHLCGGHFSTSARLENLAWSELWRVICEALQWGW